MRATPFGDRAILLDFDGTPPPPSPPSEASPLDPPALADSLRSLAVSLRNHLRADTVVGPSSLLVVAPHEASDADARRVLSAVEPIAADTLATPITRAPRGPTLVVHAVYDGPDLDDVARTIGATCDELIALHTSAPHRVAFLGFLPGFAYLGPVATALCLPRRATPRPRVPALAIGLAGGFTGIYPFASPGGWHLLARAVGFEPFDPTRDPPSPWSPGDLVRFVPVTADEGASLDAELARARPRSITAHAPTVASPRSLEITAAPAAATIQAAGRHGRLAQGLPPSGPLDPEAHAAANLAVGNRPGAAAIEVPLGSLELRAGASPLRCSIDGAPAIDLAPGDPFRVPSCDRAVRYLAVAGGLDVPEVLGCRSTLLAIRLGGLEGRPLRRRDVLPVGPDPGPARAHPAPPPLDLAPITTLAIVPGPHHHRFPPGALATLLAAEFRVSRLGDRVGVRLEGPAIPCDGAALAQPCPMLRGAVEITPDGTPIVLGPDHPVTGGYPVLATLRSTALAHLARLPPGHVVRFVVG